MKKKKTLWNEIINGKYEEEEKGWYSQEVREGYGVRFWKATKKDWVLLSSKIFFLVGHGRRVKF